MTNPNRNKGFGYERELLKKLDNFGFHAERCWGSDGRTRGLPQEVDVVMYLPNGQFLIQTKRIKRLPLWLGLTDKIQATVTREDHGTDYIIMKLDTFLNLIQDK